MTVLKQTKPYYCSKYLLLVGIVVTMLLASCGSHKVLEYKEYVYVPPYNVKTTDFMFTVQNMDNEGMCDPSTLTASYKDFYVRYVITEEKRLLLEIENRSNKTLILDKAKCYVITNGYSKELFKDVRSGRSTTYGSVQDAINNVQTNENSVTLQIPPYSKWKLPIAECNIPSFSMPPFGINQNYTVYEAEKTIEYILTYTYDYALSQWSTSRNRLWIEKVATYASGTSDVELTNFTTIVGNKISVKNTFTTLERREAENQNARTRIYNRHVDQQRNGNEQGGSMWPIYLGVPLIIGGAITLLILLGQ